MGNVYEVRMVKPAEGAISSELSGRFAIHEGSLYVLEDRFGHLQELEDGPLTPRKQAMLDSYARAMYYALVATEETWVPGKGV